MDIEPQPPSDRVQRAVAALTHFGDELDRETAARLIRIWRHFRELTPVQVEEVLRHFPVAEPDPLERPQPGGGWISGPSVGGDRP